jgi:hypothetical protein
MAEATGKPNVTIEVNKKSVEVTGPRLSGLAIKQAAISQGVSIELDFQLAEIKPNGRDIVGDEDVISVNKNSKFVATAADDNS